MSNVRYDEEYVQGVSGGEILPPDTTSSAHVLPPADDHHVAWARANWPELAPDDVDWTPVGKMKVTLKETGAVLRIDTGMPVGGEASSDVRFFCVRDGRLILLAEPGGERPVVTVHGQVHSRELEPRERVPRMIR